jgi:hypothetical protein
MKEVIDEYLAIAEYCVRNTKVDGGIYGYPATLLMFVVIDALSMSRGFRKNTLGALNQSWFRLEPKLTERQLKNLRNYYRNLLAHQALIAPGVVLTAEAEGGPFGFSFGGELTTIRVVPFCELVRTAWQAFDKSLLKPKVQRSQIPGTPVDLVASTLMPFSASGSMPEKTK